MPKRKKGAGGARPGAGRPRKPKALKKTFKVWIAMTDPEANECKRRAEAGGLKLQDWARAKLLS